MGEGNRHKWVYVTVIFEYETSRILVESDEQGERFYLPRLRCAEAPCYGRKMCEHFQAEMKDSLTTSFDLAFLYTSRNEAICRHSPAYPVAMFESLRPSIAPAVRSYLWVDVWSVGQERFPEFCDKAVIPSILRIKEECSENGIRPWEKPGWLRITTEKATVTLGCLGYEVTSPFRQFIVTSNSAILKVETDKGLLYLKASNNREGTVTDCIARLEPKLGRRPLYVDTEREWMFMENYGETMEEKMTLTDFENLAKLMGPSQRRMESEIETMKEAGVPRVDPGTLLRRSEKMLKDVFLSDDIEKVLQQSETPGEIERFDEKAIGTFCNCMRTLLKYLYEGQNIPVTVLNGDHADFNVIKCGAEDEGYVFIDWGNAHIDLPLRGMDFLWSFVNPVEDRPKARDFEDTYHSKVKMVREHHFWCCDYCFRCSRPPIVVSPSIVFSADRKVVLGNIDLKFCIS